MNLVNKEEPNLLDPYPSIAELTPKIQILLVGILVKKYFQKAVKRRIFSKVFLKGINNS